MKVDLMKAYDSVRWDFVDATIIKMGFPKTIMVCVTSCQFSINVNGELMELELGLNCCKKRGQLHFSVKS